MKAPSFRAGYAEDDLPSCHPETASAVEGPAVRVRNQHLWLGGEKHIPRFAGDDKLRGGHERHV